MKGGGNERCNKFSDRGKMTECRKFISDVVLCTVYNFIGGFDIQEEFCRQTFPLTPQTKGGQSAQQTRDTTITEIRTAYGNAAWHAS